MFGYWTVGQAKEAVFKTDILIYFFFDLTKILTSRLIQTNSDIEINLNQSPKVN